MQVACTSTPEGNIYRVYRATPNFATSLKPVVAFLLAGKVDVFYGDEGGDPALLLRIGPISGEAEATLRALLGPYMPPGTS